MAKTAEEKKQIKQEWSQLTALAQKFAAADVATLYVVDHGPLIGGGEAMAALMGKIPRAAWTRGKQGHGKKR